jgi:hypothetical protein
VQSVYDELKRDVLTRQLIGEIARLRTSAPAAWRQRLQCRRAASGRLTGRSELDGRWRATLSQEELIAAGLTRQVAASCRGCSFTLQLDDGRFFADLGARYFWSGKYTVDGKVLRLFLENCSPNPCSPIESDFAWSLYRGTLSFSTRGGVPWAVMVADTFSRVR